MCDVTLCLRRNNTARLANFYDLISDNDENRVLALWQHIPRTQPKGQSVIHSSLQPKQIFANSSAMVKSLPQEYNPTKENRVYFVPWTYGIPRWRATPRVCVWVDGCQTSFVCVRAIRTGIEPVFGACSAQKRCAPFETSSVSVSQQSKAALR